MEHALPLISTLVGSLVMAFVFGMLAHRLRITPRAGACFVCFLPIRHMTLKFSVKK